MTMVGAVRFELTLNGALRSGLYRLGYAPAGAPETIRTSSLGFRKSPLCPLSYRRVIGLTISVLREGWSRWRGFEPATCRLQGGCSAKLSYTGAWIIRRLSWLWWAQPDSNRQPIRYERTALPLSYAPSRALLLGYAFALLSTLLGVMQ